MKPRLLQIASSSHHDRPAYGSLPDRARGRSIARSLKHGRNSDGADPSIAVRAGPRWSSARVCYPMPPILRTISICSAPSKTRAGIYNMPIWMEGYAPPPDPRLRSFSVTPDPGVLEINLPPAEQLGRTRTDQYCCSMKRRAAIG